MTSPIRILPVPLTLAMAIALAGCAGLPDQRLANEALKRAYLPHKGVISLVVKLARGEHVQIAMIGRDSIFGAFSALGDACAGGLLLEFPRPLGHLAEQGEVRPRSAASAE